MHTHQGLARVSSRSARTDRTLPSRVAAGLRSSKQSASLPFCASGMYIHCGTNPRASKVAPLSRSAPVGGRFPIRNVGGGDAAVHDRTDRGMAQSSRGRPIAMCRSNFWTMAFPFCILRSGCVRPLFCACIVSLLTCMYVVISICAVKDRVWRCYVSKRGAQEYIDMP